MSDLLSILFGCSHRRTTFPQGKDGKDCHIACLDCGREFAYDWQAMRVASEQVHGRLPDTAGRGLAGASN